LLVPPIVLLTLQIESSLGLAISESNSEMVNRMTTG